MSYPTSIHSLSNQQRREAEQPHVAILMCTYNGAPYILEQLESFKSQIYKNWSLWVSDDGSHDNTAQIINEFSNRLESNQCTVHNGPQRGFYQNFLKISTSENIKADFFAWSDQDDIWKEDKIENALKWLSTIDAETPALYCTRTELIDESGASIGFSPHFKRPPSFKNALVQSIAGGNTMVFNEPARKLLKLVNPDLPAPSHDWLLYLLVSGAGGKVCYDATPGLLYRQHSSNIIGSNSGLRSKIKRISMLFQGNFKTWNSQNIRILEQVNQLDKNNQNTLVKYKQARDMNLTKRLATIRQLAPYRQTLSGNIALILAALIKRL